MDTKRLHINNLYFFSAIAVVVFLPWSVRWFNYALICMALFGLWTTTRKEKWEQLKLHREVLLFTGLFMLYVLGLFYSANVAGGLKSVEQKIILLVIPLVCASSIALTGRQLKTIQLAFVLSVTLLIIASAVYNLNTLRGVAPGQLNFNPQTLVNFENLHPDVHPAWMQFSYIAFGKPLIYSPTLFSLFIILATVFLFHLEPSHRGTKVLKFAAIGLFSVVIVLLASRMGIFAFLAVLALNMLYDLIKKFSIIKASACLAFMCLLAVAILQFPVTRFRLIEEPMTTSFSAPADETKWNSFNLRYLEWKSGLEGIKSNRLFGTGTANAQPLLNRYYSQVQLGELTRNYSANNQFIQTYLELGITGFVVLLLCFLIPAIKAIKQRKMLLLSLILITTMACVSNSMFEKAKGLMFYVTFLSFFFFTETRYDVKAKP